MVAHTVAPADPAFADWVRPADPTDLDASRSGREDGGRAVSAASMRAAIRESGGGW